MIKAVILDMDGTMFSTEEIFIDECVRRQESLGLPPIREVLLSNVGSDDDTCNRNLREALGEEGFQKFRLFSHELFAVIHDGRAPVKKGLFELLDFLKENGYKIGVATATPQAVAMPGLTASGVDKYMDTIVCGDMVERGRGKPHPDIYLMACGRLGVAPEEAMGIEDSRFGIMAVHAAGMYTVMIPDLVPCSPKLEGLADIVLEDLSQVIGLLREDQRTNGRKKHDL